MHLRLFAIPGSLFHAQVLETTKKSTVSWTLIWDQQFILETCSPPWWRLSLGERQSMHCHCLVGADGSVNHCTTTQIFEVPNYNGDVMNMSCEPTLWLYWVGGQGHQENGRLSWKTESKRTNRYHIAGNRSTAPVRITWRVPETDTFKLTHLIPKISCEKLVHWLASGCRQRPTAQAIIVQREQEIRMITDTHMLYECATFKRAILDVHRYSKLWMLLPVIAWIVPFKFYVSKNFSCNGLFAPSEHQFSEHCWKRQTPNEVFR